MENIALIGKARSGKDTAAAWLVRERAYARLSFADPLKEMALRVDPIVTFVSGEPRRLFDLVRRHGWEHAKDEYPEVRRILQHIGQAQREHDPDYWVNLLLRKVDGAARLNIPVVVTDVRYANEAEALRARGFTLVRIVRPERALSIEQATHPSEMALNHYPEDLTIYNTGAITDLERRIAEL